MTIWESIFSSWRSIRSTRLRSTLTILSIVIGVASVVFLVGIGEGQKTSMTNMFKDMGANAFYVQPTNRQVTSGKGALTLEDAESLLDPQKAPAVAVIAPLTNRPTTVTFGNEKVNMTCIGVTQDIKKVQNYPVEQGKFITDLDVQRKTTVAVLGFQAAQDLFKGKNPIGQSIRIASKKFQVIGVVEKLGGRSGDSFVLIPLTTMQSKIVTERSALGHSVGSIAILATSTTEINTAVSQVTAILRQRHHIREGDDADFTVINMAEILKNMEQQMAAFAIFLGFVGAIALFVGGIGIMNIMLVSVTERTREIGIRKAVGAKRKDILGQFLLESAMLSLSGGIIGLLIALGGSQLISGVRMGPMPITAQISPVVMTVALSVSVVVGLISGSYPAFRAASLDPIESLRHE